jgi:ATP-dependent RNA helicase RhlB
MNAPQLIQVEADKVSVDHVQQRIYYPGNEEKIALLLGLLAKLQPERAIVFANTKVATETIQAYLEANGVRAAVLSGDVPQRKRQNLILQFGRGEFPVLVATDVAARGLHIPDVSHVFNFDLPQDAEDYVHRIGRTARLGGQGEAISFACEKFAYSLPDIETYIGRKIPSFPVTGDLLITPQRPPRPQGQRRSSAARPGRRREDDKSG